MPKSIAAAQTISSTVQAMSCMMRVRVMCSAPLVRGRPCTAGNCQQVSNNVCIGSGIGQVLASCEGR